jgi:hypothetical protein
MKISSTLNLADFKVAHRISVNRKLGTRNHYPFVSVIYSIVLIVTAIVLFITMFSYWLKNLISDSHLIESIIFEMFLVAFSVHRPIIRYYVARTWFRRFYPAAQIDHTVSIDIDDERILFEVPGIGESKILWRAIIAFEHEENVALLYMNESKFLMFSTSELSPAQFAELKDLFVRNGAQFCPEKSDSIRVKILKDLKGFWGNEEG